MTSWQLLKVTSRAVQYDPKLPMAVEKHVKPNGVVGDSIHGCEIFYVLGKKN